MPKKLTREEFIRRANEVHKGKYDYSKVEYTNAMSYVTIICPTHGEFQQIPSSHLRGCGCQKCSFVSGALSCSHSQDEFIDRAIAIHGNKYDYSQTRFNGYNEKVYIICPRHGGFWQFARTHVCEKRGCEKCAHEAQRTMVHGIGINDLTCEGKSPARMAWEAMLQRCYAEYGNHPTYMDCAVCDEWHYLSNFKAWFENPQNGYRKGYHLGKDIIVKGNRIYSPETCCLVPRYINEMLVSCTAKRGKHPIGVYQSPNVKGFIARMKRKDGAVHLGVFHSAEDAFAAYKAAKEAYIKEIATDYFSRGEITKRVYDALMRYEVEITD